MRKAYLIGLFWLSLTILLLVVQARSDEPIEQPSRAIPQPQCVQVAVADRMGGSLGTGAYIGPKLVVTCWHVVKDRKSDDSVTVKFPLPLTITYDGRAVADIKWQEIPGTVILSERKKELALIELESTPHCAPLSLSSGVEVGQTVSIQGYGGGKYKQLWGTVYEKKLAPDTRSDFIWFQIEGAISVSGDSGGPVIDERGRYVGTLWGADTGLTAFLPSDIVIEAVLDLGKELENFDVPPLPDDYSLDTGAK